MSLFSPIERILYLENQDVLIHLLIIHWSTKSKRIKKKSKRIHKIKTMSAQNLVPLSYHELVHMHCCQSATTDSLLLLLLVYFNGHNHIYPNNVIVIIHQFCPNNKTLPESQSHQHNKQTNKNHSKLNNSNEKTSNRNGKRTYTSAFTTKNAAIPPINAFHFCIDRIKEPNQKHKHKHPAITFIKEKLKN